ncbi:MAG: hypothetical protein E7533_03825 [Ruminococcaceae bacterium]|nr:hypothetical protein [Oscillospiraceae bacterium]
MDLRIKSLIKCGVYINLILLVIRIVISFEEILATESLYDLYGYISESIVATLFILGFYEKLLWRFNPFCKTPKIYGTYDVILKSSYDQKSRNGELKIKQTLLTTKIKLKTEESSSTSIDSKITKINEDEKLIYTYINTPKNEFRDRSNIHYGTVIIDLCDLKNLFGMYYTDRKSRGDIIFKNKR